jgi:hypothetical protein
MLNYVMWMVARIAQPVMFCCNAGDTATAPHGCVPWMRYALRRCFGNVFILWYAYDGGYFPIVCVWALLRSARRDPSSAHPAYAHAYFTIPYSLHVTVRKGGDVLSVLALATISAVFSMCWLCALWKGTSETLHRTEVHHKRRFRNIPYSNR